MPFEPLFFQDTAQERVSRSTIQAEDSRGVPRVDADRAEDFAAWLFRLCGLPADRYRWRVLARRLPACLRMLRAGDVAEARRTLEARPELAPAALDVMLLGVTEFCRDPGIFGE